MAMRLNAGDVGRQDLFTIDHDQIIADDANNGRAHPVTDDVVEALARSIAEYGQLEPVLVRRVEDNRVSLVAGFTRRRAVMWANEHLALPQPLKLQCRCIDCNPEESLVRNLKENLDRKELSPIDIAHAKRRLSTVFSWSEERIAEFFGKSVAFVRQMDKLLRLEKPIQAAVANGTLGTAAALDLAELPEAKRPEVLAAATDPVTQKVNPQPIRAAVREQQQERGKGKGRTVVEIKTFLQEQLGPAERPSIQALAYALLEFVSGKITEEAMRSVIDTQCKE